MIRTPVAAILACVFLASPTWAGTLVWEQAFADEADISGAVVPTADVQVNIQTSVVSDFDDGGPGPDQSTFGTNSLFFKAEHGTTGNHAGYGFLGFDNPADDPADFLRITLNFSAPVEQLAFSLLDIDQRVQGGNRDFDDAVIVTYNGGVNVITSPSLYTLGPNVIVGDEGLGEFEGLQHSGDGEATGNASTDSNINLVFGALAISSVTIQYFSTNDAPANPSGQLMGISDLVWVVNPEPGTGLLLGAGMVALGIHRRRATRRA